MAGYAWEHGKSWNAVKAEREGKMVASDWAKWLRRFPRYRGLKAVDFQALVEECEWHHSSKFYNEVNYYDCEGVFEARHELRERAALRKEFAKLTREMKKRGITHLHFVDDDGQISEWYDWQFLKIDAYTTNDRLAKDVRRLRSELEFGYANTN